MLKITVLVLACAGFYSAMPIDSGTAPDIDIIKHYIARGRALIEFMEAGTFTDSEFSLNPEDQTALKYYNFYYNLAYHPSSYFSPDNDSIVCFPNKKCVNISDIGIYP
ncbi:hypothetical protein NQ315_001154 [Exocentrus adspersus]|uniref:Uncharacterized protein n=1 Tax=Exocentrus adspersus TaxID=1586481 RepID=A0AAV8WEN9_9CUCU|nr:hypothetical protein NQ315_001154 [Exocentrus adspersus]